MRASSTASGSSALELEIRPRRIANSRRDFEQFARSPAQDFGARVGHHDGIAKHDRADRGMIGLGWNDKRHAGLERRMDLLEQVRLRIPEQAETMAAHP